MAKMENPDISQAALLEEIEKALRIPDLEMATRLARTALDQGFIHPLLLNLRAYWLERAGDNQSALVDLQRAHELLPTDISILNALGLAYGRLGHTADAAKAFEAALAVDPEFGPAHYNRGWAKEELGELEAAHESFTRATELQPMSADPSARLAALAARRGNWAEARDAAALSLARDPQNEVATIALAQAETAEGQFQAADKRLRVMLAGEMAQPLNRAAALGALADSLDAQNRTGEAFETYAASNEIVRGVYASRYQGSDLETVPEYIRRLITHFEVLDRAKWQTPRTSLASSEEPLGHIFIVGFPRSGTTLLEEVLARNPAIITTQERDALSASVREFMSSPNDLDKLSGLGGAELRRHRRLYWRQIQAFGLRPEGKIVVDKQPYNTVKLPIIARLFPNSKIIFMVRDPRDVVLSCIRRRFRMNPSNFELLTLEGAAHLYDLQMRLAELYFEKLPLTLYRLRQEDLVQDFEAKMKDICSFAGLAWDKGMKDFGRSARRAIATPSAAQLAKGLTSDGIARWRQYRHELAPVLPVLEPWAVRYGYLPS